MNQDEKEVIENIIYCGVSLNDELTVLSYLQKCAKEEPNFLFEVLNKAIQNQIYSMAPIVLAILATSAPEEYLKSNNTSGLAFQVLSSLEPDNIIIFVELLKDKIFGKGFGSRAQKWVRWTMEAWTAESLKLYQVTQPKSLYSLLRLVHPKLRGQRGEIVKEILD